MNVCRTTLYVEMSGVHLPGVGRGFTHNEHQQVERPGILEAFDDFPENNENKESTNLLRSRLTASATPSRHPRARLQSSPAAKLPGTLSISPFLFISPEKFLHQPLLTKSISTFEKR